MAEEYSEYADAFKETKQIMCTLERKQWDGERRKRVCGTSQIPPANCNANNIENMFAGMDGPSYERRRIDIYTYAEANGNRVYDLCALLRAHAASSLSIVVGIGCLRSTPLAVIMFGCWQMGSFAYTIEDIW